MNFINKLSKRSNVLLYMSFCFIIIFPGLFLILQKQSFTPGMLLASSLIIFSFVVFFADKVIFRKNFIFIYFFGTAGLFIHFIIVSFVFDYVNAERSIIFFPVFSCLFFASYIMFANIELVNSEQIKKIIDRIYYSLVLLSILFVFLSRQGFLDGKEMFFFAEPSHFALMLMPFYYSKLSYTKHPIINFILILCISVLILNLTLMIGAILGYFLIHAKLKNLLFLFFVFVILAFLLFNNEAFSYFFERLNVSTESENISVLVMLSGYERAFLAFLESYGLGFGFQNMGYLGPLGSIQLKISRLGVDYLNIYDGSFFLSKFIYEFGFFGVLLSALYVYYFFSKVNELRNRKKEGNFSKYDVFICFFISFCSAMIIRSGGYMDPSIMFMLTGLWGCMYSVSREK